MGGPESWLLGANVSGARDYTRLIDLNNRIEKYTTPSGYRKLTFDNGGRITQIGDHLGSNTTPSATQVFAYDGAGRLTYFSGFTNNGDGAANINQTQMFSYDANGNRSVSVLNNVTSNYTYPGGSTPTSNRLASVSGGFAMTNVYDSTGSITGDGTRTFIYDSRGRMTSATASGVTTNYLFDYRSLRVKKSNATETRVFVYDDDGHMLGEYDQSGAVVQEVFWLGDTPVAIRGALPCLAGGGCTETATAYVWTDHLNTPRELTRANSSNLHVSLWKWDSLPFGETSPNQNPSNLGVMNFKHRFPGQYSDSETALYQNWHREYEPKLGRYVESDPIGLNGGLNTYAYAQNNPLGATDKTGLAKCDLDAALEVAGKIAEKMSEFVVPESLTAQFGDVAGGAAEYLRNTHIKIDKAWYGGILPFDAPPGLLAGYPTSYELLVTLLHEILHHNFYTEGDSAANEANPNYTGPRNHAFINAFSRAIADFFKDELRKAVQKHCHCN